MKLHLFRSARSHRTRRMSGHGHGDGSTVREVRYVFDCQHPRGVAVTSPAFPQNTDRDLWTALEILRRLGSGTVTTGTYTTIRRGTVWFAETSAPHGSRRDMKPIGVGNHRTLVAAVAALASFTQRCVNDSRSKS